MTSEWIIEAEGLTKEFAGFMAVSGVDLRIRRGSIHAIIGPNGAGKTTCFNLLTKFIQPSAGCIRYNGRDITGFSAAEVARLGMVRSFQISAVFPHLTVLENVRIALQRERGNSFDFWRAEGALDRYNGRALELLDMMDLGGVADQAAIELSYGRKRTLEFATTLALQPDVLLLDEPTAGMGREDIGRMIDVIRQASAGRTVLMVEHNLRVVENLCETVTVLARGRVIAEGPYKKVSAEPAVVAAYLGTVDA